MLPERHLALCRWNGADSQDAARYVSEPLLSESLQEHPDTVLDEFPARYYPELEAYKNILSVICPSHFILPSL